MGARPPQCQPQAELVWRVGAKGLNVLGLLLPYIPREAEALIFFFFLV